MAAKRRQFHIIITSTENVSIKLSKFRIAIKETLSEGKWMDFDVHKVNKKGKFRVKFASYADAISCIARRKKIQSALGWSGISVRHTKGPDFRPSPHHRMAEAKRILWIKTKNKKSLLLIITTKKHNDSKKK
jgi:hypothetical protein